MITDNEKQPETDNEKQPEEEEIRGLYDSMAKEAPAREAEVMLEEEDGHKTLSEEEDESPNLTDLQVTLRKLFPALGDKINNALMMARVAPDMFIPLLRILVNSAIKRMDRWQPLDVAEKATLFYVLTSIGLDGKGRIDTIELAGSAKESDELDALGKSVGAF